MKFHHRLLFPLYGCAFAATLSAQGTGQVPVVANAMSGMEATARAEMMMNAGHTIDATEILGRYLATAPNDGHAWFYLGRIYMSSLKRWHISGHAGDPDGPLLADFAASAFDRASQLLTDSGGVYRTLISVERATARIEEDGWVAAMANHIDATDVPLPGIIVEFGKNLIASCPTNGVIVTGSEIELAGVWGVQLLGSDRPDLVLLRPDRYRGDEIYRYRMSRVFGTDSSLDAKTLLATVKDKRPICLSPSLDTLTAPKLGWKPSHLVMVAGGAIGANVLTRPVDLSVHQLSKVGLAGSVWSAQLRDLYDAAARLNPLLCRSLFTIPESNLPTIPSCRQ